MIDLIDKIIVTLKNNGVQGLLLESINFFLRRTLGLNIVKSNSIGSFYKARKIFSKCTLSYSEGGFYFLDPMPSVDELNYYYTSLYWDSRAGKQYGVNNRDILHFVILKELIPETLVETKVFMNFGAGHGGISNLCWLEGMEIVNVEPSALPQFYNERWSTVDKISDLMDNSVDLVYGSHSLEHVQNIDDIKTEVARVLKPGGYVFWEVPNAACPSNGAQIGKVDIPHTYYFETKFFEKWFINTILCKGYKKYYDVIEDWKSFEDDNGQLIRALGQLNNKNID